MSFDDAIGRQRQEAQQQAADAERQRSNEDEERNREVGLLAVHKTMRELAAADLNQGSLPGFLRYAQTPQGRRYLMCGTPGRGFEYEPDHIGGTMDIVDGGMWHQDRHPRNPYNHNNPHWHVKLAELDRGNVSLDVYEDASWVVYGTESRDIGRGETAISFSVILDSEGRGEYPRAGAQDGVIIQDKVQDGLAGYLVDKGLA